MPFFHCLGRVTESVQVRGALRNFVTIKKFTVRCCEPHAQPQSCRTTPCRLSATAYSVYSQRPSVPGELPSIRNLKTRHAVVTRDPPNMVSFTSAFINQIIFPVSVNFMVYSSFRLWNYVTQFKRNQASVNSSKTLLLTSLYETGSMSPHGQWNLKIHVLTETCSRKLHYIHLDVIMEIKYLILWDHCYILNQHIVLSSN
jgi:hypothetical protein